MTTDGNSNKESTKPVGQAAKTEDVGDFMSSFRSALTTLDNAQGGGRNAGRSQVEYGSGAMDVVPFRQGASGYGGFRPEGILSLAMGMSGTPYTNESLDGMEYEDESHMETGPDYVRMGYSRTVRGRGIYGQRSSRVGVQMMMGQGGFGFRSTRSSRLGFGGGMGEAPTALLLGILGGGLTGLAMPQDCQNPYCLIHGTKRAGSRHQHGHCHHESGEDGYNGPEIVELSDDEQEDGQVLALPAPSSSDGKQYKTNTRNKNTACGFISEINRKTLEDKSKDDEKKINKDVKTVNRECKTNLQLSQMSEKVPLRRKQPELDNRFVNTKESTNGSHGKAKIPMEASNIFKFGFSTKFDKTKIDVDKNHLEGQRSNSPVFQPKCTNESDETASSRQKLQNIKKATKEVQDLDNQRQLSLNKKLEFPGTVRSYNSQTNPDVLPLDFEENHFAIEAQRGDERNSATTPTYRTDNKREVSIREDVLCDGNETISQSNSRNEKEDSTRVKQKSDTDVFDEDSREDLALKEKVRLQDSVRCRTKNESEVIKSRLSNLSSMNNEKINLTKSYDKTEDEIENDLQVITSNEENGVFSKQDKINLSLNSTKSQVNDQTKQKDFPEPSYQPVNPDSIHVRDDHKVVFAQTIDSESENPVTERTHTIQASEVPPKSREKGTFYQMIKSHLPHNISQGDLDRTLGLKTVLPVHKSVSEMKTQNVLTENFQSNSATAQQDGRLRDAFKQFEHLSDEMSHTTQNPKPKLVKQKNFTPRFQSNVKMGKEQSKDEHHMSTQDGEKSTTSKCGNDTQYQNNEVSTSTGGTYRMVRNSAGMEKSSTHHTCTCPLNSYASRCSSCKKVHIHCDCCDAIIRTLCGNCENCRGILAPNSNYQPLNRTRWDGPMEEKRLYETVESMDPMNTNHQPTNGPIPPKKPMRNKNAPSTSPTIRSPNFTTKSKQNTSLAHKSESMKHSGYYNDSYYQRQRSSSDRLSSLGDAMLNEGLVVKDVYPDGNCFFAAIVDQLRVRGEFFYTAKSLRIAAVNYLKENPNQEDGTPLLEFVSDHVSDHGGTWEGYLSRLRRDGEWADHIIISAISSVLKRRIVIHSIRRSDYTINKTIMEPDCLTRLSDHRETNDFRKDDDVDDMDKNSPEAEPHADEHELFEDLLLGHIPEAHYVSLRYLDWEERLFQELRSKKSEPHKIITEYGNTSKETGGTQTDSNEDPEGQPNYMSRLPNTHNNFLLKYIHDGYFLSQGPFQKNPRPKQSETARTLSRMLGVGDRNNDLESYLISDNYACRQYDKDLFIEWLISTPNDCLITEDDSHLGMKNLRPVTSGCPQGFLKLNPVSQNVWPNKVIQNEKEYYLKHLHIAMTHDDSPSVPVYIAFKSEWPREALACKRRLMKYRDVIQDDEFTFRPKLLEGVRVVPICSDGYLCHKEDCVEWKYTFSVVEYVICQHILTDEARFCFKILDHFLTFLFTDRNVITKEQIKAVFFHTCDDLQVGIMEPDYFEILSHFLTKLERCLCDRNIPDFFFGSINLIDNIDPLELQWHYERTKIAKEHYLVYMFLFLDQKGLMEKFSLSKCFDSLLFNAFWKKGSNYYICFENLTVLESREWVLENNFDKALAIIEMFQFDDLSYSSSSGESDFQAEYERDLHKHVLRGIPLQEQWLYAFYLECRTGLPLVNHVNKGRDCTKLKVYFGAPGIQLLVSDENIKLMSTEIELPLDICLQEGVANFAAHFYDCLKVQLRYQSCSDAADASIHYFLCHHTDILLRDIAPKTGELETESRQKGTLEILFKLFYKLFRSYRAKQMSKGLTELVEKLDKVTGIEPNSYRYEQLASIWSWLANTLKSQEALEKANTFRQSYTYSQKATRV